MNSVDIFERSFKMLNISYVTVIYFSIGMVLAKMMDIFYGNEINAPSKSKLRNILEVLGMLWLNGIVVYFILTVIPLPLGNGQDLTNTFVFIWSFLYYQKYFQHKATSLYNSLGPKIRYVTKPKPVLTKRQIKVINNQISKRIQNLTPASPAAVQVTPPTTAQVTQTVKAPTN